MHDAPTQRRLPLFPGGGADGAYGGEEKGGVEFSALNLWTVRSLKNRVGVGSHGTDDDDKRIGFVHLDFVHLIFLDPGPSAPSSGHNKSATSTMRLKI